MFFNGQNLKHAHMSYSYLELLIFFWLILLIILDIWVFSIAVQWVLFDLGWKIYSIKGLRFHTCAATSAYYLLQILKITLGTNNNYLLGSGILELENRVKKRSYALWRHKTELSQIVTS